MDIYWQHVSGMKASHRYTSPDQLLSYSDKYYEDYCITKVSFFMLKTVGVRSCEPDYHLVNKYQERHVMHWIISGEGWCNGIPVREGDVIYCKHHVPYNFSSNPENPCVYAWITFEGEILENYLKHMGLISRFRIYRTQNLRECYAILYDLLYTPHGDSDIHLYFDSALLRLLSLSFPNEADGEENSISVRDPRLRSALQYIAGHYHKSDFRVHQVSDAIGISEKHFRRLFKDEMGVSVREYVIKMRMDAAVTLLRTSNYNITEIAEIIGYTDYRQFSEIFKNRFGCSPKQYKNKNSK